MTKKKRTADWRADIRRAGDRFTGDTDGHQMTVKHDDGLYRHLRFADPKSSMYWFDLITWPGRLTIDADMGTWTFARLEDMFEFFRARSGWNHETINPGYWAEKIRDNHSRSAIGYSEKKFRTVVAEQATEYEAEFPGLKKAVFEQIFGSHEFDLSYEENARLAVDLFTHTVDERTFRFNDAWEWDLKDHSIHFLWCCHAIQWGIGQYDAAKSAQLAQVGA